MSPEETPHIPDPHPAALPSPVATVELFEKAVRTHSRRLLAIARAVVGNRAAPEDVLQQALVNLYQHRARYDWHEPGGVPSTDQLRFLWSRARTIGGGTTEIMRNLIGERILGLPGEPRGDKDMPWAERRRSQFEEEHRP